MASLPIRRQQFDVQGFASWLARNGAEVGIPTNPYEVIRYRAYDRSGAKAATHIVYSKENGLLNFQGSSREHYTLFSSGCDFLRPQALTTPTAVAPKAAKLSKTAFAREKLLQRDGDECWFCGLAMGDDITIEHLVPKSAGGGNKLANYALAHARCNHLAADKPLIEKIELRSAMRAASVGTHPEGQDGEAGLVRSMGGAVAQPDAQTTPSENPS